MTFVPAKTFKITIPPTTTVFTRRLRNTTLNSTSLAARVDVVTFGKPIFLAHQSGFAYHHGKDRQMAGGTYFGEYASGLSLGRLVYRGSLRVVFLGGGSALVLRQVNILVRTSAEAWRISSVCCCCCRSRPSSSSRLWSEWRRSAVSCSEVRFKFSRQEQRRDLLPGELREFSLPFADRPRFGRIFLGNLS
ncbi:hypothetical protein E2C01_070469 [Portunus trituberculatus]|uniref:Uncharacterized protein n=1 Tax=Portunus trituberculatus TaxID=210409 RepID=A0A5B7I5C6_PORTR|nr:hypothetical protein [Portunus trituberculatus]